VKVERLPRAATGKLPLETLRALEAAHAVRVRAPDDATPHLDGE
jgi:acyl-coenzyme A synthetase/AMP-(fatty) acid ligase